MKPLLDPPSPTESGLSMLEARSERVFIFLPFIFLLVMITSRT